MLKIKSSLHITQQEKDLRHRPFCTRRKGCELFARLSCEHFGSLNLSLHRLQVWVTANFPGERMRCETSLVTVALTFRTRQ